MAATPLDRGALASLWSVVEDGEVSGGVLHCYVNEYDCRSSCDYHCVRVESCEYSLNNNYVCLPSFIWLIVMTLLPCICLLLFIIAVCCGCSQSTCPNRCLERFSKRKQTSPLAPPEDLE